MADAILPWKWILPGDGQFEAQLDRSAFLLIYPKGSDRERGSFLLHCNSELESRLRVLLAEAGGAQGLEAKVIVRSEQAPGLRALLQANGLPVRKWVERASSFQIRYDATAGRVFVADDAVAAPAPVVNPVKSRIKVLIVDDSPTIRKLLHKILSSDPELEVVGGVGLPSEVEPAIEKLRPDVITLDIHLPEMNGVELLRRYLPKYPIPTVMISSISVEEGPLVLNALESGAVDYIQKPGAQEIDAVSPFIVLKVKTAARASLQKANSTGVISRSRVDHQRLDLERVVAIGSSTGGTEALKEVFLRLPEKIPPIVVVQHIPAVFSKAFADRMNQLSPFEVLEGENGMEVKPGRAIIAPGGMQMSVHRVGAKLLVKLEDSPPVNRHKPSVDVLMDSVAKTCGGTAIGVILTGMGSDGAKGLLAMKNTGSATYAQDEASCVVFGMPQAAFKLGATASLVPLKEMAETILGALVRKSRSA